MDAPPPDDAGDSPGTLVVSGAMTSLELASVPLAEPPRLKSVRFERADVAPGVGSP